ncbi:PAQR family membrane homeostasis protein TrhA [Faecalibacter rhinopitheci]|uniref:Hemolysin III family protein n=1 Tax=Faecalibacter rhinopitheci TaxID=2779678 RepID=A0A8J7FKP2_9FLAO|nr:hemolysin III family protein [Faecalibacter rhinopitheci]MBF0596062.1 hemolysin III family protein [Faecalibacter rhinopitheci]
MNKEPLNNYSPLEEKFNIYTHCLGFILSIIALFYLTIKSVNTGQFNIIFSFVIFGISMILLYLASTLYHSAKDPYKRSILKILDHVSIYVLIAGTYTPYTLVSLKYAHGFTIFSIVWIFAILGILLKLLYTGKFKLLSTLLYVFMGWMIVFSFSDLQHNLSANGIEWLVAGGIAYTIGAILYSIKQIPFNHAIFHVFVLLGTFCHFISIFLYVK